MNRKCKFHKLTEFLILLNTFQCSGQGQHISGLGPAKPLGYGTMASSLYAKAYISQFLQYFLLFLMWHSSTSVPIPLEIWFEGLHLWFPGRAWQPAGRLYIETEGRQPERLVVAPVKELKII